jgi:hypothetical protein
VTPDRGEGACDEGGGTVADHPPDAVLRQGPNPTLPAWHSPIPPVAPRSTSVPSRSKTMK